jgi:hypothetical protein
MLIRYTRHRAQSEIIMAELKRCINSVSLSPQANCTEWATAICRRNLVSTFADRGVSRGQRGGTPTALILSFLDLSPYFFFQVAHHLFWWGWVDPVQDPLLLRKSGNVKIRTRDLWVCSQKFWPLDHRWNWNLMGHISFWLMLVM